MNKLNKNDANLKKKYHINNNLSSNKINSVNGYECIGPCYPSNTVYYNPLNLVPIKNEFPSCPIKSTKITNNIGDKTTIDYDKCNDEDINKGHLHFDIFNDFIQISTSSDNFLKEIYNINDIYDIVKFLSNSIDSLPIYSQRRILKAIYEVYYKYVEFPKLLFSSKLLVVLKNIYKINNFNEKNIISILNDVSSDEIDIYTLFYD